MAAEPSNAEIQSAMADILKEGELSKLTSRIVRSKLEDKFGVSFLGRKKEIDKMLMEMIENQEKSTEDEKEQENGTSEMNGTKKKRVTRKMMSHQRNPIKFDSGADDDAHDVNDAELARKLHENEERSPCKKANNSKEVSGKKKASKSKETQRKQRRKERAKPIMGLYSEWTFAFFAQRFGKLMVLSAALAEVVGEEKMSRSDVVKKMWEVIRERKLEVERGYKHLE
ncbi:hypothetical protein OS493_030649 [Desmophyllum pertusum]|uniref:DEK-C domain-containing protein n=1 Tax=Desmophyllum pertusum TaxID=174260 RepID=A0A9W9ZJY9_9CNID|nr:hypothetical protein OS493_030649 [Desmophyllum pertusum]